MIKKLCMIILCLLVPCIVYAEAVTASLTANDTFTGLIRPAFNSSSKQLNISIKGTWSGTISLLRSDDGWVTYGVVDTWTSNTEEKLYDADPQQEYKIGFTAYSSGTADCTLSKGD